MPGWLPLPREHGAWGMLLQPLAASLVLARRWDPLILPAIAAVLLAFLLREPLLTLARQRWQWRVARPESAAARAALAWQLPCLLVAGFLLWRGLPAPPLAALASLAVAMTALGVFAALRNLQRALPLQLVTAVCLNSTALLGALAATREIPAWAYALWAFTTAHSVAAIYVVRARLALKSRSPAPPAAWLVQLAQLPLAAAAALWSGPLSLPFLSTALVHAFELRRLRNPQVLDEPLRRVGFRALFTALAHTALTTAVLW